MYNITAPIAIEPLLSPFQNHLSSSIIRNNSIICLGLPLAFFPSIFHSITVISSESTLSVCLIHFLCLFPIVCSFFSNYRQHFFICYMFCPADLLHPSSCPLIEGP